MRVIITRIAGTCFLNEQKLCHARSSGHEVLLHGFDMHQQYQDTMMRMQAWKGEIPSHAERIHLSLRVAWQPWVWWLPWSNVLLACTDVQ